MNFIEGLIAGIIIGSISIYIIEILYYKDFIKEIKKDEKLK